MIIYVVETGIYSDHGVAGVYASAEAAMEDYTDGRRRTTVKWTKDKTGAWSNNLDWQEHVEIVPFEVIERS